MVCKFCQHEFDDSLTECPYCHKQVDFEPKSLTREERDSFSGTTIDIDDPGSRQHSGDSQYQDKYDYQDRGDYQRADRPYGSTENPSGFKVYRLGGSLITWIIFALIVLGIIFFVLPAFLFVGVIGAAAVAIIIFLSRLFQ
ncbi:MAG: hypothetical protein IJ625_05175 [Acidaminococcaceae bacterium]|nr:hypothetical protein [Acidaminococcaceae bacterium]